MLGFAVRGAKPGSASLGGRGLATAGVLRAQEKPLFDKVLIANRGEIACRVMRTCKRMGIQSIAVYSDADAAALHTKTADIRYHLGPAPSNQSYLVIDKLVRAVQETGAQAVHPGYGFLSENRKFAEALENIGVAFVGPKSHAIKAMGDKLESKIVAKEAKVNTIPGYNGVIADADEAVRISREIGYPVMLKASAGGGGKGMRVAWNDHEAVDGFRLSSQEAKSAFNDDRILIEKFIDNPRHIEIQVLADGFGNAVYLNERECSVQRRNQKVVEEAPSSFLDAATRRAMGEQAVALAKAVQYQSAGTVEFLVDSQRNFYFLEMNTRLQVEHAISECITGVDIVEHMLRVAAGEKLAITQDDVHIDGWAIEARVYAEDSFKMLPSTGRLNTYIIPEKSALTPGVRVDTGVLEGSEISMYYDPMIAKLVTHGKDRADAIEQMKHALDSYVIKGVNHNIPLLRDIVSQPRFASGDITTKFIPEVYPRGFQGFPLTAKDKANLVSAAAFFHTTRVLHQQGFLNQRSHGERLYSGELIVSFGDDHVNVAVDVNDKTSFQLALGPEGASSAITGEWSLGAPLFRANINGDEVLVQYLERKGATLTLGICGSTFQVTVREPELFELAKHLPAAAVESHTDEVQSPMTGTVVSVVAKPGDYILADDEVAVIEAMKMQNQIKAPRSGLVKAIAAVKGTSVMEAQVLVELYAVTEPGVFAPQAGVVTGVEMGLTAVTAGQKLATITGADGVALTVRANVSGALGDFALKVGQNVAAGAQLGTVNVAGGLKA